MNINKLRGKIVERGLTMTDISKCLNIDRSTLYRKISENGDRLTVKEANVICDVLELSKEEAMNIFFTNFVA